MYINTSGPFTAHVLAAQAEGSYPPASNNCDIWKEPLWFSSHLILVAFGQNPQVWHGAQVRPGAEREKRRKEYKGVCRDSVAGETQHFCVAERFQLADC